MEPVLTNISNKKFVQIVSNDSLLKRQSKRNTNPFIEDVFYEILSFITDDFKFILNCRLVCKQWDNMILNSSIWNNVEFFVSDLQKIPLRLKPCLTRIECNN